jgi:hypothetical protein
MDEEGEQEKKEEKEGGLAGGSGLCAGECKRGERWVDFGGLLVSDRVWAS